MDTNPDTAVIELSQHIPFLEAVSTGYAPVTTVKWSNAPRWQDNRYKHNRPRSLGVTKMAKIILHHNGVYNLYTTVADGACYVSGLTLDQLQYVIKEEEGQRGLATLPDDLARAHSHGTSCRDPSNDLRSVIEFNNEGLSFEDFVKTYLTIRPKES